MMQKSVNTTLRAKVCISLTQTEPKRWRNSPNTSLMIIKIRIHSTFKVLFSLKVSQSVKNLQICED